MIFSGSRVLNLRCDSDRGRSLRMSLHCSTRCVPIPFRIPEAGFLDKHRIVDIRQREMSWDVTAPVICFQEDDTLPHP